MFFGNHGNEHDADRRPSKKQTHFLEPLTSGCILRSVICSVSVQGAVQMPILQGDGIRTTRVTASAGPQRQTKSQIHLDIYILDHVFSKMYVQCTPLGERRHYRSEYISIGVVTIGAAPTTPKRHSNDAPQCAYYAHISILTSVKAQSSAVITYKHQTDAARSFVSTLRASRPSVSL